MTTKLIYIDFKTGAKIQDDVIKTSFKNGFYNMVLENGTIIRYPVNSINKIMEQLNND